MEEPIRKLEKQDTKPCFFTHCAVLGLFTFAVIETYPYALFSDFPHLFESSGLTPIASLAHLEILCSLRYQRQEQKCCIAFLNALIV